MTELEILQRQLRESKMRLRELRTENAELKIQHRRWLIVSAIVSVFSLLLSLVMVFTSGDIVIQGAGGMAGVPADNTTWEKDPVSPIVEYVEPNSPAESFKPLTPPRIDDDLEAPPLILDEPVADKPTRSPSPLTFPSRAESSSRPASGGFVLPGSSAKPKKRVEQYVVQKNDSLWKIVSRFYGTATPKKIQKVMQDNGLVSSQIKPGSTLLLIID